MPMVERCDTAAMAFSTHNYRCIRISKREVSIAPNQFDDTWKIKLSEVESIPVSDNISQEKLEMPMTKAVLDQIGDLRHNPRWNQERSTIAAQGIDDSLILLLSLISQAKKR